MKLRTKTIAASLSLAALLVLAPRIKAVSPTLVEVVNSLDEWIPTGSIDEPGRAPVLVQISVTQDATATPVYSVPAGKRLVIKEVTLSCTTLSPVVSGLVNTTVGSANVDTFFPITSGSVPFYQQSLVVTAGNALMQTYSDPQTRVELALQTAKILSTGQSGFGPNGNCQGSLSGYLATLPITITATGN
jgi:hypothetical protein